MRAAARADGGEEEGTEGCAHQRLELVDAVSGRSRLTTNGTGAVLGGDEIATARSPGAPSVHAVFSKVEEGTVPVPFPRRTGPEDDHSNRTITPNFRPWWCCLGSEKVQNEEEQRGREEKGGGGGWRGKERGS